MTSTSATSCPLRVRLGMQVERAARADVVEMGVEEPACRARAGRPQHLEELVVVVELGVGIKMLAEAVEHDAMHVHTAVLPGSGATREPALVDQPVDERDRA